MAPPLVHTDDPRIKQFLVLWLVLTAKPAHNDQNYIAQLTDLGNPAAAQALRADLAHRLGFPDTTIVDTFLATYKDPAKQNCFDQVRDWFHKLIVDITGSVHMTSGPYDGDFCPWAIEKITDLK